MPQKEVPENITIEGDILQEVSTGNFQSRSEAAQEIIDRRSSFIEKWALMLFFIVLLCLFGGTWFIRYPDIIETRATLTSYNGPKEIIPLQTGRLIKLFVQSGRQVKQGEMLGWIESTAAPNEVLKLSAQLDSGVHLLSVGKSDQVSALFKSHFENLGSIQTSYQTYIAALQQFNDYLVNGFYARQKKMILNDIVSINNIDSALVKQRQLTEKDNDLSRQTYEMNEKLFKERIITSEEFRQQQSKLVNKQMEIPQINSSILSNENQQRDKLKELQQLEHDVVQQRIVFEQALQTLKSNVDDWRRQYILTAPLDGILFFAMPLQQNQFVEQGKLLGYINPSGSKFYVETYLPQNNLGKIDSGMEVQLRFDAYPYQEDGFIKGRIDYISKVASDSGYLTTIRLVNGLKTNLNQPVQYKSGLKANALIITKDMRLMKRLYYNVIKASSVGK